MRAVVGEMCELTRVAHRAMPQCVVRAPVRIRVGVVVRCVVGGARGRGDTREPWPWAIGLGRHGRVSVWLELAGASVHNKSIARSGSGVAVSCCVRGV